MMVENCFFYKIKFYNLSKEYLLFFVDNLFCFLGVDYIDVLLVYCLDLLMDLYDIVEGY